MPAPRSVKSSKSIKQVADIVSDIATASAEQSTGVEQINKALTQMDEVTQQNSALVEENAATAKTLEQQAQAMDQRLAFFRIAESDGQPGAGEAAVVSLPGKKAAATPAAAAKAAANGAGRNPIRRMQGALATAWKDF